MSANKQVINDDKTHLMVMGTRGTAGRREEVILEAGPHLIRPSKTETLLGIKLSQDLKWKDHIMTDDRSMIRQLTTRINGLKLISSKADFKTRLQAANGVFQSKLCYAIQLWGGTENYLLRSLQVLQNKAARVVTRNSWYTPTGTLLRNCNWLSVHQLSVYQTILSTHQIVKSGRPLYLSDKLSVHHPYKTRQAVGGGVRFSENFGGKSSLINNSFCYRGMKLYNKLPVDIRTTQCPVKFKLKLKKWIRINITVNPD